MFEHVLVCGCGCLPKQLFPGRWLQYTTSVVCSAPSFPQQKYFQSEKVSYQFIHSSLQLSKFHYFMAKTQIPTFLEATGTSGAAALRCGCNSLMTKKHNGLFMSLCQHLLHKRQDTNKRSPSLSLSAYQL